MRIEELYRYAYRITGGSYLYKDVVHEVYLKIHGKEVNDAYVKFAIYHRWLDILAKKGEASLTIDVEHSEESLEVDLSSLDEFESEIASALNEGYTPKEIADLCQTSVRMIWHYIREIKNKLK